MFNIVNGELVELSEQQYDTESVLQELLEKHPDLMPGNQISPGRPRKWLLVRREMGIPDSEDASDRWSIDHVFLDQDGTPTLVEVKRSTDTRIRREVVGQMLDYAANAVVHWPVEKLQAEFEARCRDSNSSPNEKLEEILGDRTDESDFWLMVKTNLQAGKVRLLFIADEIPSELRRIIEFLNEQMDPAEVLGVEIKQFVGGGVQSLVPRVIGQTVEAENRKGKKREKKQWDEASFMAELNAQSGEAVCGLVVNVLSWAKSHNVRLWWGQGAVEGSVFLMLDTQSSAQYLCVFLTSGKIQIPFGWMKKYPPYDSSKCRDQLREKLNQVEGISISGDAIEKWPRVDLNDLVKSASVERLIGVMEWSLQLIKSTELAAGSRSNN
ncbi:hypothetical protein OAG76_01785 [Rubripirellula sp.]|nr:hypothetical protein [Rubripirellula sp.]MDB4634114.1 hypothetical protein [Rubripirellula sp.]